MNTKSRNRGQSSSGADSTACFHSFRTPTTVNCPPSTVYRPLSTVHCLLFTLLLGAGTAYGQQLSTDGNIIRRYRENGTNYYIHIFTNSGTLNLSGFSGSTNVQYLVVAGGGGGGGGQFTGSGGGAGGVRLGSANMTASAYTITVGDGGVGCPINGGAPYSGTNGYPSSINGAGVTVNTTGGGRGNTINMGGPGNGGSGGGGHWTGTYGSANGGSGELGNNGAYLAANQGCGGGGARTAGGQSSGSNGGVGGGGTNLSFSGVPVVYASGGDGASTPGGGWGTAYFQGADGASNTGNGGGGSCNMNSTQTKNGGKGGSGIVIVRYADSAVFSPIVTVTSATAVWPFQPGAFTISRPADTTTNYEMAVSYTLTGTATHGVDYAAAPATNNLNIVSLPGYVKFGVGETSIVVNLYPLYNPLTVARTATLTLAAEGNPAAAVSFPAWNVGKVVTAVGGTMTNYPIGGGSNWIAHIFTNVVGSTDFTLATGGQVEYLVVAGGGGGGGNGAGWNGGGGGAGGVRFGALTLPAGTYTIAVGDGGAGNSSGANGANGSPSLIGGSNGIVVANTTGGGRGGIMQSTYSAGYEGWNGGSGGGGIYGTPNGISVKGAGELGNNGGATSGGWSGSGGGGAGAPGQQAPSDGIPGVGGSGTNLSFSGVSVEYAKGGKGAKKTADVDNGVAGTATRGNGGNGGLSAAGGKGGSGIVIVRYVLPPPPKGTVILMR